MLRFCALLLLASTLVAVEHPFILWTPAEAAAIRSRIAEDPDARAQLERMRSSSMSRANPTVWNLFRYAVLEEAEAGEREKRELLRFIGRKPEPMTWDIDPEDLQWNKGMPSSGDSHMRDEQTLNTLRYDALYHLLSDEERAGVEAALRTYIDFHLGGHKPWHPSFRYNRTGWLPNMHWPRAMGTHLMAAALGDTDLIRAMHESQGGWKWYLDEYLADERFYMEEFGKSYSNIGTMLLYCEALSKLGLDEFGYGYTGTSGATMRKHLEQYISICYPRLEAPPGGMPRYAHVTMGDAQDLQTLVHGIGYPGRKGKPTRHTPFWRSSHMNGPLPKMLQAGWFEIGHKRWPDAGFDYFLAQMREAGDERYLPSLYWNLQPIDPQAVIPPAAPSYVSRERGFALLRADQTSSHWEGSGPAVALQFGMYYVHYVHDCFSILQYVAHNRQLYGKMGRPPGRKGYAGGDDWKDHVRGHCGVVVDGLKAKPIDNGNVGCAKQRVRDDQRGPGRFVAVRAVGIYPDVDQERALVLTDDYLLDVFRLVSDRERTYDWQVLAYGETVDRDAERWTSIADWRGVDAARPHLSQTRVFDAGDQDWAVDILQHDYEVERAVGVRVRMLGTPGSLVLDSRPPGLAPDTATSLLVTRTAKATSFNALHEPFAGGPDAARIDSYEGLHEDDRGIAVRIRGEAFDDRLCIAWGDDIDAPRSVVVDDERIDYVGYALLRSTPERLVVQGTVSVLRLRVDGTPLVEINGQEVTVTIDDGLLVYEPVPR